MLDTITKRGYVIVFLLFLSISFSILVKNSQAQELSGPDVYALYHVGEERESIAFLFSNVEEGDGFGVNLTLSDDEVHNIDLFDIMSVSASGTSYRGYGSDIGWTSEAIFTINGEEIESIAIELVPGLPMAAQYEMQDSLIQSWSIGIIPEAPIEDMWFEVIETEDDDLFFLFDINGMFNIIYPQAEESLVVGGLLEFNTDSLFEVWFIESNCELLEGENPQYLRFEELSGGDLLEVSASVTCPGQTFIIDVSPDQNPRAIVLEGALFVSK